MSGYSWAEGGLRPVNPPAVEPGIKHMEIAEVLRGNFGGMGQRGYSWGEGGLRPTNPPPVQPGVAPMSTQQLLKPQAFGGGFSGGYSWGEGGMRPKNPPATEPQFRHMSDAAVTKNSGYITMNDWMELGKLQNAQAAQAAVTQPPPPVLPSSELMSAQQLVSSESKSWAGGRSRRHRAPWDQLKEGLKRSHAKKCYDERQLLRKAHDRAAEALKDQVAWQELQAARQTLQACKGKHKFEGKPGMAGLGQARWGHYPFVGGHVERRGIVRGLPQQQMAEEGLHYRFPATSSAFLKRQAQVYGGHGGAYTGQLGPYGLPVQAVRRAAPYYRAPQFQQGPWQQQWAAQQQWAGQPFGSPIWYGGGYSPYNVAPVGPLQRAGHPGGFQPPAWGPQGFPQAGTAAERF